MLSKILVTLATVVGLAFGLGGGSGISGPVVTPFGGGSACCTSIS